MAGQRGFGGGGGPNRGPGGDRGRDRRPRGPEVDSEWQEKVVQIRRVTKVVKGGKKLSFRAIVIVGNGKGQVGVGVGKAAEVITAIQKGGNDARKHMTTVPLVGTTLPHPQLGTAGASKVLLRPASKGTGVIAGGAVRIVLELAGVKDVLSKSLGSDSPLGNARATIDALETMRTREQVAMMRGKEPNQVMRIPAVDGAVAAAAPAATAPAAAEG